MSIVSPTATDAASLSRGRRNTSSLADTHVINALLRTYQTTDLSPHASETYGSYQTKLTLILSVDSCRSYYYQLAFTLAYRLYSHQQQPTKPRITLQHFARQAQVSFFCLSRLFTGRATNESLLNLIHFLHGQGIDLGHILHFQPLIDKAFTRFLLQTAIHHTETEGEPLIF